MLKQLGAEELGVPPGAAGLDRVARMDPLRLLVGLAWLLPGCRQHGPVGKDVSESWWALSVSGAAQILPPCMCS